MTSVIKNLIILLGLLTLVFAAYYFYEQQSIGSISFQSSDQSITTLRSQADIFVSRRETMSLITLDVDVVMDPRMNSLQRFSTPIVPKPVGRPNPFLPLENTPASQFGTSSQ